MAIFFLQLKMDMANELAIADFRVAHRGGLGVRTIPTDKRNGKVIGLAHVTDKSNLLLD